MHALHENGTERKVAPAGVLFSFACTCCDCRACKNKTTSPCEVRCDFQAFCAYDLPSLMSHQLPRCGTLNVSVSRSLLVSVSVSWGIMT
jgi:hypothetical protein